MSEDCYLRDHNGVILMERRPKRKKIPLGVRLQAALYALGFQPGQEQWDHDPALQMRPLNADGTDTDPPQLDPRYIVPRLSEDHKRKTFGDPAVPLSGDISKIAKTARLERDTLVFRERFRRLVDEEAERLLPRTEPKRKIPSRPFPKRRKEP